ncbi:uncharacterized protein LOC110728742 isoform X2 [Chenopodium quinoa]|uniref:uncharacterized protein LOC110728742 isoform X2 n=1 Tax=Chenopodium quinoa TaxID=63459 RepID=UPI000B79116A|nr:uncharacterized protein LOC110728742 isoform X2 [Chenopodium quinoa]
MNYKDWSRYLRYYNNGVAEFFSFYYYSHGFVSTYSFIFKRINFFVIVLQAVVVFDEFCAPDEEKMTPRSPLDFPISSWYSCYRSPSSSPHSLLKCSPVNVNDRLLEHVETNRRKAQATHS